MDIQARKTPREEYFALDLRSRHAQARGSGTGADDQATRPQFPSGGSSPAPSSSFVAHLHQQHKTRALPIPGLLHEDDYPESMTRSSSTLSSSQGSHANSVDASPTNNTTLRSPGFDTAVYDPTSDSIHIMPHSRQSSLDVQFRDFKDRLSHVKSHQVQLLSLARPQSLNLPLRSRESCRELRSARNQEVDVPARACSVRSRNSCTKSFDLMAPPPGKRRSCMPYKDGPLEALVEPCDTVDADPSDALTSQIASSILRERYGVDSAEAVPLKVQEAVRVCLRDVSSTVEHEHPQWRLPTYRPAKGSRSAKNGIDRSPKGHSRKANSEAPRSRKTGPTQPRDEDEDPFQYDEHSTGDGLRNRRDGVSELALREKAKSQDVASGYPCPYRRRNPVLFNIRDHEHCARRNFADLAELKRHVRTHHRKQKAPYQCPRCSQNMASQEALSSHLTVPLEMMCEPQKFAPGTSPDEGITEEMDRILADRLGKNKVQTWEEMCRLLFGPDSAIPEPEFLPIVEVVEAEQEFDDSADDLKHDLCERLQQLIPDHAGDVVFFQVLAGQIQLVVEQHRAKVNRHCRQNAGSPEKKKETGAGTNGAGTGPKHRSTSSRYSISAAAHASQNSTHRFSPSISRRCTSNTMVMQPPTRTTISPATASSVYSTRSSISSSNSSSRPQTRSSGTPVSNGTGNYNIMSNGSIPVESPRLPFRDWVHGIKLSNAAGEAAKESGGTSPGQRDSGLALQCDECCTDPCQCGGGGGSYADQLSAFMTPAAGPGMMGQASEIGGSHGDVDWAAHYGVRLEA